jgi:hypothetical protein
MGTHTKARSTVNRRETGMAYSYVLIRKSPLAMNIMVNGKRTHVMASMGSVFTIMKNSILVSGNRTKDTALESTSINLMMKDILVTGATICDMVRVLSSPM